jgi:hypothetical protein
VKRRTLLHDILGPGGLSILFQPIFEIAGGQPMLFALEALARGPKGSNVEPANVLFEYVAAGLMQRGDANGSDRVLAARQPHVGRFESVIDRVADHVRDRVLQLFDDRRIDFDILTFKNQHGALALRTPRGRARRGGSAAARGRPARGVRS